MKSNQGSQILFLVVASVIVLLGVLYFSKSIVYSREQSAQLNQAVIAELYAAELLELLRSHTPDQLKTKMSKNPVEASQKPYKFCAHVNLLNRKDGFMLNADPIADLPPSVLDGPTKEAKANRYYQIQIADIKGTDKDDSITVNKDLCKYTAEEIYLNGDTAKGGEKVELKLDERFVLTVGVSWLARDKKGDTVKQVVLSSLIPERKVP
jgi:hypothetical protein